MFWGFCTGVLTRKASAVWRCIYHKLSNLSDPDFSEQPQVSYRVSCYFLPSVPAVAAPARKVPGGGQRHPGPGTVPAASGLDRNKFLPVSANWKEVKLREEAKQRKLGVINPRKRVYGERQHTGYGRYDPANLASCIEERWKYLFIYLSIYPMLPTPPGRTRRGRYEGKRRLAAAVLGRGGFGFFWQAKTEPPQGRGPSPAGREAPRSRRSRNSGRAAEGGRAVKGRRPGGQERGTGAEEGRARARGWVPAVSGGLSPPEWTQCW